MVDRPVINIAPHLVQPMPCVIPTYKQVKSCKLSLLAAFKLYDIACLGTRDDNASIAPAGKIISKSKLQSIIPNLDYTDMTGGALWYDALSYNSERLVLEFILSAIERGADAFNYLKFEKLIVRNRRVEGIRVYDKISGSKFDVFGKIVVNASGPWINTICSKINPDHKRERFYFAKAVNILIKRKFSDIAFGLKDSGPPIDDYSNKNRFLFFIPWRGATMIGTWYFNNINTPDEVTVTESELVRCIGQVRRLIPDLDVQDDEICFVHAGLISINFDVGRRRFDLKTKYSIIDHQRCDRLDGLISVQGVKYTIGRNVSVKVIDIIQKKLKRKLTKSGATDLSLTGGRISNVLKFIEQKQSSMESLLSSATIRHLAFNYGSKYNIIEKMILRDYKLAELVPGSDEAILAELIYCMRHEFAYHLTDLLIRRLDVGSLSIPKKQTIDYCADFMAREMGWSAKRKQDEIDSLLGFYDRFTFR